MMVNLLAAGGFEMPAVMITLLLCLAAGITADGPQPQSYSRGKNRCLLCAGACLAACIVIVRFGLLPVTASENHVRTGNSLLTNARFPARALDQFQQAVLADPQSVTPRNELPRFCRIVFRKLVSLCAAETEVVRTEIGAGNGRGKEDDDNRKLADEAFQACENLISTDRRNCFSYRLRAEVRWNVRSVE